MHSVPSCGKTVRKQIAGATLLMSGTPNGGGIHHSRIIGLAGFPSQGFGNAEAQRSNQNRQRNHPHLKDTACDTISRLAQSSVRPHPAQISVALTEESYIDG